ncbi:MAG: DUF1894 domain-containing protein [Methanoregula sp.]|nr:DUF1894 domain-containing protein [Methanoregula sp.]MDD3136814.1 DUF1894 domain-containing protein [Methanoregula sp.]MDD5025596.1 DUF1894 domain-containing protein [Methanoregula sp.]MDD5187347.1 DUF1894 domain-containing protein [Methanoregula sp.]
MGCVESMNYEILMRDGSFKECRAYIKEHFTEYIEVQPGFKILDIPVIGIPPIAIGLDRDFIIFPYTKPCHGTFLLRVEDTAEAARLRAVKKST